VTARAGVRLFAALELPPEAVHALGRFAEAAADPELWRLVPAQALHVTLAFMGTRDAEAVRTAGAALRAAAGEAPQLELAGALLLPPRRPRVLSATVADPGGTLAALQERVARGLAGAGLYEPEARPFRPHVTVARLRPRARAPRAVAAVPEPVAFTGTALTLFASRLHPSGARYEPLERVELAAGASVRSNARPTSGRR
jgi:2'-5' RNA ligase